MDWKEWTGKQVFIRTKHGKVYSGIVKSIDSSSPPIHFIYIIDKFKQIVAVVHSEILEIKEEVLVK